MNSTFIIELPAVYKDPLLQRAIMVAAGCHAHQVDKAGKPYIEHCMRVLEAVAADLPEDIEAQCAAVLHDVIEDCDVGPGDLMRLGIPGRAAYLVCEVSRNWALSYQDWIRHIAQNAELAAKRIKLADLRDNGSPARLELIEDLATRERLRVKYDEALLTLIEGL